MNAGLGVGKGDPLPLAEECVFLLPHMPIPTDPRSVQKAGMNPAYDLSTDPCYGEGGFSATTRGLQRN